MSAKSKRIQRTFSNLVTSLSEHIRLLEEDFDRAFIKGEKAKLADIAGRLRMLVYDKGTNKPLLLDLMKEFKSTVKLVLDLPPQLGGMKTVTLPDWLDDTALVLDGGKVSFTNKQFLAAWAQQAGSAHEDWKHEETFVAAVTTGVSISGMLSHECVLRVIAKNVLLVAQRFLKELTDDQVRAKDEEQGKAGRAT